MASDDKHDDKQPNADREVALLLNRALGELVRRDMDGKSTLGHVVDILRLHHATASARYMEQLDQELRTLWLQTTMQLERPDEKTQH